MIRLYLSIVLGLYIASAQMLCAQEIIRSSVSPGQESGLHSKYLKYLAEHMDMQLSLNPMPFARRLQAIRDGELDIMVGLQKGTYEEDSVIYLEPNYGIAKHCFFVLADSKDRLTKFDDLRSMTIGVTIHARYYEKFNQQDNLVTVNVQNLEQKINLLLNNRIDSFIHYEKSTLAWLKSQQLESDIVLAQYQPVAYNRYYFIMSRKSPLMSLKDEIEKILLKGKTSSDFKKIASTHDLLKSELQQ